MQPAATVAEERCLDRVREPPPRHEIRVDLAHGVGRERDEPGLVELAGADHECPLDRVVVAEGKPDDLAAPQSRRVQQDDREAEDLAA
jgi:hypothetical protein